MILLLIFTIFQFLKTEINSTESSNNINAKFSLTIDRLKNISTYSICELKSYSIESNYYEFKHPYNTKECHYSFVNNFVTFEKGVLNYKNNATLYQCKYQCNYPKGEWEIKFGKWKEIQNARPKCDVFEVQCFDSFYKHVVFRDVYIQIYKIKKNSKKRITFLKDDYPIKGVKHKYNIHIIVLDAISHYNMLRGFKKTLKYLEKEYSAVVFKHNNKVGANSRPNGLAFLVNTRIQGLHDFFNLKEFKPSDFKSVGMNRCTGLLDNHPYISKYFKQLNYIIFNGEDAKGTVFTGMGCKGFEKQVPHHTLRPYTLKLFNPKYNKNGIFLKNYDLKCIKSVKYQLGHLVEFMETYYKSRQFTTTWITHMSHNKLTGHFEYDQYFETFFKRNKKLFNKGFLIFMSDHGFRAGAYRRTKKGEFEDSNPFLIVAPPKDFRTNDNEVLKNLKINSNKHTSHFDIYATMLDIATEGSRTDFKNMTYFNFTKIMKNDKIKGVSLLREIKQNRTCYQMEISSEYCLCRENFTTYDQSMVNRLNTDKNISFISDSIVSTLRTNFITELNKQMSIGNITQHCEDIKEKVNGIFDLEYTYTNEKKIVFYLKMEVYPKGIFEAYFNEQGKIALNYIDRIDKYGKYANLCLPNHMYKRFCYCKKNRIKKY